MFKNKLRLKNCGFTLVETMVSVAVMTVVVLGVLQILGTQLKVSNTARIDADVSNTVFLVNALLKNSNACKENIVNFGTKKVSLPANTSEKLQVTSLDYPAGGGKVISVGGTSSSKSAVLKEMYLSGFKTLSNSGGYNILSSELNMQFEKPNAMGAQVTNRKVAVQLRTDGSGTILDCSGEGTELTPFQLEAVCLSSGGSFNFGTKKCTLPQPVIPPPQIIVQQMPVPVPLNLASSQIDPNFASGNGGNGTGIPVNNASNNFATRLPAAVTPTPAPVPVPAPAVVAAVMPAPQPVYIAPPPPPPPPPTPTIRLYQITSSACAGVGTITASPTCMTVQFFDASYVGGPPVYWGSCTTDVTLPSNSPVACPNAPL